MENIRFNYKECLSKLDNIISLNETKLPLIDKKNMSLNDVQNILKGYKYPILYRYMPINEYAISGIRDEDVYMIEAISRCFL